MKPCHFQVRTCLFLQNPGTIETGYNDLFLFCFWEDFTIIDLHKGRKAFCFVGACQRDVLRSSPTSEKLLFSHYFLLVYLWGIGCQEEFFKIRKTKRTFDEAFFLLLPEVLFFILSSYFLFHICKPFHSLRKLCNRLIRISVLDAVAHAVLGYGPRGQLVLLL